MRCKGRLRHRFHGTYTAVLLLAFETPVEAGLAIGGELAGGPWELATDPRALVAVFTSEQLVAFEARYADAIVMAPCGWRHCGKRCKAKSIGSCVHSIDYGPEFELDTSSVALKPRRKRPVKASA